MIILASLTWSGFNPGGTQVYSSSAHPESSSEWANVCLGGAWPPFDELFAVGTLLFIFCWLLFCWLSMELLSCVPFWWAAAAAAAAAAIVAAAKGSEPPPWVNPLKAELWSSLGHLQFLQTCLKNKQELLEYYVRLFVLYLHWPPWRF